MCYAIVALAMDLIWGYTGILSWGTPFCARRLRDGIPDALIGTEGVPQDHPTSGPRLEKPRYWSFTDHFWH
jgi:urea transport system permease protein